MNTLSVTEVEPAFSGQPTTSSASTLFDPNTEDFLGNSPLYSALLARDCRQAVKLLRAGANPNWAHKRHETTPLQVAIDFNLGGVALRLIKAGARLSQLTGARTTLEQFARDHNREGLFKRLVAAQARWQKA